MNCMCIHVHMYTQAPLPDVYRGKYKDPETAGQLYAEEVKKLIDQAHSKGRKVLCLCCMFNSATGISKACGQNALFL